MVDSRCASTPSPDDRLPGLLRCCGYRPRRGGRWVGYCLELHLRAEGRDWDEVLERLVLAASMRLAELHHHPERLPGKAPFHMRLCYAWTAFLHFVRPQGRRRLADLSPSLLLG
ncbi:MAG: hypothetical protein Q9Q40_03385 [Acidobacteriota bacterium]|nr:hypothetical protein [Acidobacteriota bacterium]MDQ7086737.1 hypothetical protein [Acidobacteriota bacterium]